jgi:Coilin N-terminus
MQLHARVAAQGVTHLRVKLALSSAVLRCCGLHRDWSRVWFELPDTAATVADLIREIWAFTQANKFPNVKLACDGFFLPHSASVGIVREGDLLYVMEWSEDLRSEALSADAGHAEDTGEPMSLRSQASCQWYMI